MASFHLAKLALLVLLIQQSVTFASIIHVTSDHLYQRISVEVTDQVPRHLCQDTLNNLEVSNFVS